MRPFQARLSQHLRRWLVWLLLATVPLYGSSGVLLSVVGPAHRHVESPRPVAPPPADEHAHPHPHAHADDEDWLQPYMRRLIGEDAAALLAVARLQHSAQQASAAPHHHGLFEHHHHAASDASVQLLGPGEASAMADLAAVGQAMLPFLQAESQRLPALQARSLSWPSAPSAPWASRCVAPLLRPPRA